MNQILTDEELINIADDEQFWDNHFGYQECDAYALAKAIEQAILKKLNSAEPVAEVIGMNLNYGSVLDNEIPTGTKLFTHPPAPSAIESQAAEIAKYKALCDQMGEALHFSHEETRGWYEELTGEDYNSPIINDALEAWRAMK